MGRRGRNRKGYYVALLYCLDLQYQRESRHKSDDPRVWQPSPRNRPDQFFAWVQDVLATLDPRAPETWGEVLGQLAQHRLPFVSRMLQCVARDQVEFIADDGGVRPDLIPLEAIEQELSRGGHSAEKHPQARKFAQIVSDRLDEAWKQALITAAHEYMSIEGLPSTAVLLGGLPPSFTVLNERIFSRVNDTELVHEHKELTVLQFYGLVVGTAPAAPREWQSALDGLLELDENELRLLRGLSDHQVHQLHILSKSGWALAMLRRGLRLSATQWRDLGACLRAGEDTDGVIGESLRRRLTQAVIRLQNEQHISTPLSELASSRAWGEALEIDEELLRLVERGDLRDKTLHHLRSWKEDAWEDVKQLLAGEPEWAMAYLEDRRVLGELFQSRTGARLNIRDLFPRTVSWLDAWLGNHMQEALVDDVGELETLATLVTRRVQEIFWGNPGVAEIRASRTSGGP